MGCNTHGLAIGCVVSSIVCFWFHLGIHRVLDLKPAQPNVLFIIVDDLRPALGVYGDSAAVTPHLDQLGAFGTVFTRAFAQFSVCGPSRASLLSSRKPDTLGCWHNGCDFEKYGNFTGLPEFFRSRGYHTTGYGKIYHNVYGSGMFGLPLSAWTVKPRRPLSQLSKRDRVCSPNETFDLFCPVDMLKHPFTRFSDSDSKRKVVRFLEKYAARRTTQPFFYAAGLYLPHVPMKFPKYLLDLYPRNKFLAHPQRATYGVENATSFTCNDWWTVMNLPKWKGLSVSPELELEFKRHYYASTTFMDYQIGMIVQALTDTKLIENTIISVVADHGFALGEHGFLAKRLNLDVGLQVPWIVWNPRTHVRATFKLFHPKDLIDHPDRVPKLSPGHMIGQVTSLLDVYPTLSDLAGLGQPPKCPKSWRKSRRVPFCTDGTSHALQISKAPQNGTTKRTTFAVSQNVRYNLTLDPNIQVMGYTIRNSKFRFVEWLQFDPRSQRPLFNASLAVELYDYTRDPKELKNIAEEIQHATALSGYKKMLRNYAR